MFEEYAAKTIGIDFGTNNSVVGVYNTKIEKPLVIENEEGVNSTPSAVLLMATFSTASRKEPCLSRLFCL